RVGSRAPLVRQFLEECVSSSGRPSVFRRSLWLARGLSCARGQAGPGPTLLGDLGLASRGSGFRSRRSPASSRRYGDGRTVTLAPRRGSLAHALERTSRSSLAQTLLRVLVGVSRRLRGLWSNAVRRQTRHARC